VNTPAPPASPKVVDRAQLPARLKALRQRGARIVFTNGCFDILHPGHVDLLVRARALGDALVMGVNDDDSVARLKGPSRPVNPVAHRMYVLAGLECVDFVTSFCEDTPAELIAELLPDVLVKGGDWPVEAIVGRETVQAGGGEVLSLPLLEGYSTTSTIERILRLNRNRD
jgi:rfaE bifunctional protein nucleotidyltransferase chain/domain